MRTSCFYCLRMGSVTRTELRHPEVGAAFDYAATPNSLATNCACTAAARPFNLFTYPFLIMCIASIPSSIRPAVWQKFIRPIDV